MNRGDRPDEPLTADGAIEIEDSGTTLESALAEEEQGTIARLEGSLRSTRRELEELKDQHLRKVAEIENMRKRNERERSDAYRAALSELAREFLPVLDNLERAMLHATPEERQGEFGQGIGLIRRQFTDVWRKFGIEEVDTSGAFDPNVHEAVATEETAEVASHTILEVLQRGYRMGDRLVRPALVKVSVRPGEGSGATGG